MKACTICGTVIYDDGHEETVRDFAIANGYGWQQGWFSRLVDWMIPCPHDWIAVTNPSPSVRSRQRPWRHAGHPRSSR